MPFKRPGKPVGAICISPVPRQGPNPLYSPIPIEKFASSVRVNQNIPIGSVACKPPHWSSCGGIGSTSNPDCPSLNQRRLPLRSSPGETLRERIDLIVVAARKRQQLRNKRIEPRGVLGQHDRTALEQVDLRNEAGLLVAVGLYVHDIDVLFPQRLDQAMADWRFLDQERGLSVPLLHFDDLFLQSVEGKLAPDDVKHVVKIATVEQHDTGRIVAGLLLA